MKPTLPEPEVLDRHLPTNTPITRGYTWKTVQRLIDEAYAAGLSDFAGIATRHVIDEAYAAGLEDAIPADVIGLVTFMQAAFTPMTPQQEEILKQLNLAVEAIRALKGKA